MVAQLIQGAVGTAAGVLAYSTVCLLSSCLMIWLVWVHRERFSYVALLSYFTLLSTLASMTQQIHTIVAWRDIKVAQYNNAAANWGGVEIVLAGASTGLDRILFYIQYYSYNVEALLALFWAFALLRSIFGFADSLSVRALRRRAGIVAKFVAVLLPSILISTLQTPVVKSSFWCYLVIANINLFLSLTTGCMLLIIILIKYIHTRRQLQNWDVPYGQSAQSWPPDLKLDATLPQRDSIYDSWLMIRFTIAFVFLGIFEVFQIWFQLSSMENYSKERLGPSADLSVERARGDFILFMPGCTASLLVFLFFGTTKAFLNTIRHAVVPKRLRRRTRRAAAAAAAAASSTGHLLPISTTSLPGELSPTLTGYAEDPLAPIIDGHPTFMLQDINPPRPTSLSRDKDWRLSLGFELGRSVGVRGVLASWPAPLHAARRD